MAAPTAFEWLKSILETGEDLMVDVEAIKSYDPRLMCRWLSQYQDCVLISSTLSQTGLTDKRMHYDYLLAAIRKKKRYVKWVKKSKDDPALPVIMEYYNVGVERAREYRAMFSDEDIAELTKALDLGGEVKKRARQTKTKLKMKK